MLFLTPICMYVCISVCSSYTNKYVNNVFSCNDIRQEV